MNNLSDYLDQDSKLEQESKFKINKTPPVNKDEVRFTRQGYRVYMFFGIIFFILIILIKSITDDLTLMGDIGYNLFNKCLIPN